MNFVLEYPKGSISLRVENYIAKATIPSIKAFLKLCQQYGNEELRLQLIDSLGDAKNYWKYYEFHVTLGSRFSDWKPKTTLQKRKLAKKFDKIIEYVQKMSWNN